MTKASAASGDEVLQAFLKSAPGASSFREFGLGFNPNLVVPAGGSALPDYGYGDAVVDLSLGDNEEIGGTVRGGGVRWFFFPDHRHRGDDDAGERREAVEGHRSRMYPLNQ